MYVLDTNVISELRKRTRCDPSVAAWFKQTPALELHLSVLTLGEVRKGIELISKRDSVAAAALDKWLTEMYDLYADRILPVTAAVAEEWGRMNAVRPLPATDGLIGATAKAFDLTLVTRNVDDLRGVGVRLLNPFEFFL